MILTPKSNRGITNMSNIIAQNAEHLKENRGLLNIKQITYLTARVMQLDGKNNKLQNELRAHLVDVIGPSYSID